MTDLWPDEINMLLNEHGRIANNLDKMQRFAEAFRHRQRVRELRAYQHRLVREITDSAKVSSDA